MAEVRTGRRIAWYRSPIDRNVLAKLNQPSDLKGLAQTLGHLGLLTLTGGAAWYGVGRYPVAVVILLLFLHGACYAFLVNAHHEFVHSSVFRSKWLNAVFLRVIAFMSWNDHIGFWASHLEHHKYTLHPPDDLEVVLPMKPTVKNYLKAAFVNPLGFWGTVKRMTRLSFGRLQGDWENTLFPPSDPAKRRRLFRWNRTVLVGHAVLVGVSLALGWWMLPVIVTFAPFYGGGLQFLCNDTQHAGLKDNVPDFRLCCRTVVLNPFLSFLYWHMNYHTEHHMYAAVPCYNLKKLHEAIKDDLPKPSNGLFSAWKEMIGILKKQKIDPSYQFEFELPNHPVAATT